MNLTQICFVVVSVLVLYGFAVLTARGIMTITRGIAQVWFKEKEDHLKRVLKLTKAEGDKCDKSF